MESMETLVTKGNALVLMKLRGLWLLAVCSVDHFLAVLRAEKLSVLSLQIYGGEEVCLLF